MPSPILASDLIKKSMQIIGALGPNETMTAVELQDGLAALNDVLETWSTESLNVWQTAVDTFALTISQPSYTIGTGGNFNTSRPVAISNAYCTLSGIDFPVDIVNFDIYQAIPIKTITGGPVERIAYVNDFPLGIIYVFPVPSQAMTLSLDIQTILSSVASGATSISYPPGYARALQYAVAAEIAPQYGRELTPTQIALMTTSIAAIKKSNHQTPVSGFDPALTGTQWAIWQRGF